MRRSALHSLGRLLTLTLASLAAVLTTGCGEVEDVARNDPGERRGPTEEGAARTARVATSVLLLPLAKKAGDVVDRPPGVEVAIEATGSDAALTRLCARKTDVALSNRTLREAERRVCEENGITPVRSVVAHQVVALYKNKGLGIDCLTVDQLRRLWRPGSEVERYSELGRGLPDRPVALISYPATSAAYEFFARQITGADRPLREDVRTIGERLRFKRELRSTPGSLGLAPYIGPLVGKRPEPVAVNAGRGCVTPGVDSVQSGAYRPLAAPLFMYATRQSLEEPPVKDLVDYILDNPREVASYRGVVPPDPPEHPEAEARS